MKKLHVVLMVAVLSMATAGALLSQYVGKSPIIGTWHWESTSAGEATLSGIFSKDLTFTFNSDGTFMVSINNISKKGTWHLQNNKLTVEIENVIYTYDVEFTDGNSKMVLTINTALGNAYVTLAKE